MRRSCNDLTKVCGVCHKEYIKGLDNSYCSIECFYIVYAPLSKCEYCGKDIFGGQFCGRVCANKYMHENKTEEEKFIWSTNQSIRQKGKKVPWMHTEKAHTNRIDSYKETCKIKRHLGLSNSVDLFESERDLAFKLHNYKCDVCGIRETWCGKKLALQLHHIDGDKENNIESNLSILCPNCHTLTNNFKSKNDKSNVGTNADIINYLKTMVTLTNEEDRFLKYLQKNQNTNAMVNLFYFNTLKNLHGKCQSCGITTEWYGNQLHFEIHHIDGVRENNNLNNLSLLCPNCHSQTDNYGGKNKGKKD